MKCFLSLCLDCYRIRCVGKLIVDSDIIPMGSNLTVVCQSDTERCGRLFAIDYNRQTIFEAMNCSVIKTQIVISQPKFSLLCKVKEGDTWHSVCGRDLQAGCKFICVSVFTRSAPFRRKDTFIITLTSPLKKEKRLHIC